MGWSAACIAFKPYETKIDGLFGERNFEDRGVEVGNIELVLYYSSCAELDDFGGREERGRCS